jgi:hypothetical protein
MECWRKAIALGSRDLSRSLDGSDVNPEVASDDHHDNNHANNIENIHCGLPLAI